MCTQEHTHTNTYRWGHIYTHVHTPHTQFLGTGIISVAVMKP